MGQDDTMDMDFAKLFEESARLGREQSLRPGERIKGKVVLITSDTVFIDYGAKSEGWAELEEFLDEKGGVTIDPGSEVELSYIGYGPSGAHLGSCLRKTPGGFGKELLQKAFESGLAIEGLITGKNKGGLEVSISGTLTFCPFSQIDLTYCDRPEVLIGTTQKFKVIQFEEEGKNIVVSRRANLMADREVQAEKTRQRLIPGEVFEGQVTRLTPFGAFVDIGGIEGLVHISEISYQPVKDPADHLFTGQKINVQVLQLESDEKGNQRIRLSKKALEPDPWQNDLMFSEGELITGTVRNLTSFGAFVELAPGIEGLVHVSEISYKPIRHPKEKLEEGQTVEVKILEINKEQRRISLSLKEAPFSADSSPDFDLPEVTRTGNVIRKRSRTAGPYDSSEPVPGELPAEEEAVKPRPEVLRPVIARVGVVTRGVVHSAKPYGFFVDLPELGSRQRGLLHISQVSTPGKTHSQKGLREGDEVRVEIIKIDDQGKISLSQKTILDSRDRAEFSEYQAGVKEGSTLGTIADLFKKKPAR
jgi:small subunit ribosomal protein S1